jgi:hydrogenase expression/formation protein HypE
LSAAKVRPGDRILLNGSLGEHGITILSQREGLELAGDLRSDCAPLHELCAAVVAAAPGLRAMRDLTRGGLSSALNEMARSARVGVEIEERAIPICDQVRGACEIFGLDPLYVANEGKMIAFVPEDEAEAALAAMRSQEFGRGASIIGRVTEKHPRMVTLRTSLGTQRIVDMLAQDQLPRIC